MAANANQGLVVTVLPEINRAALLLWKKIVYLEYLGQDCKLQSQKNTQKIKQQQQQHNNKKKKKERKKGKGEHFIRLCFNLSLSNRNQPSSFFQM